MHSYFLNINSNIYITPLQLNACQILCLERGITWEGEIFSFRKETNSAVITFGVTQSLPISKTRGAACNTFW